MEHIDEEHHKEDVSSDEENNFQRNIKMQSTAVNQIVIVKWLLSLLLMRNK